MYWPRQDIRIPFELDTSAGPLQEVQLFVSQDLGQTWNKSDSVAPRQAGFNFRATRDGLYWFAVRTIDTLGRARPPSLQGARPELRIFFDTRQPSVTLRPRSAPDRMVAVEWDIREENLDPANFFLDYRPQGTRDWIPLTVEPSLNGERMWNPGVPGPVEVRLHVRDLARNEGEDLLTLNQGSGQGFRAANSVGDPDGRADSTITMPGTRYVNSKRFSLNYQIKDEGPSGTSAVELWMTKDGRSWMKGPEDAKHQPPFVTEVTTEGLYGFTLIVRSGVGLSSPRPSPGDQPQVWVEVDTTKPSVHWAKADVGRGQNTGRLFVTWKATDKNLGPNPITLFYAEKPEGPWTVMEKGIENSGNYAWQIPANAPYKFLVKVEAADKAGNVGFNVTADYAIVDLAVPKSVIVGVDPTAKGTDAPNQ